MRRALLLGRLTEAEERLRSLDTQALPPALAAVAALARAELALRSLDTAAASTALALAGAAAQRSGVAALEAEVRDARTPLERPAARQRSPQGERLLGLQEVAALMASGTLIVDGLEVCWARRPETLDDVLARDLMPRWTTTADQAASRALRSA